MIITRLPDPPQAEIITIADIKEFCRLDDDLDAIHLSTLETLRNAAIETGEQETGIIWRAADYEIEFGVNQMLRFRSFFIPVAPAIAFKSFCGFDGDGHEAIFDPADYVFKPSDLENRRPWAFVSPASEWPNGLISAKMLVTAGWTAENLPKSLRLWALNRISSSNERRGDMQINVTAMPRKHTERLLDRYRVMGGPNCGR